MLGLPAPYRTPGQVCLTLSPRLLGLAFYLYYNLA